MSSSLKDRVRARLDTLLMTPLDASRRAGFNRTFVSDILSGRKNKLHPRNLYSLASVLQCHPDFLDGKIDEPLPYPGASAVAGNTSDDDGDAGRDLGNGLPNCGMCEWWAFRMRRGTAADLAPISLDVRYPSMRQFVFYQVDDSLAALHIMPGDGLFCIDANDYQKSFPITPGSIVVAYVKNGDLIAKMAGEYLIEDGKRVLRARFPAYEDELFPDFIDLDDPDVELAAVVKRVGRIFP